MINFRFLVAYITNESLVKNVPKKNNKIVYYLIK